MSAPPARKWLLGGEGANFVQDVLTKATDPVEAVAKVQTACALTHGGCAPLLELLDTLGCARSDAYGVSLLAARAELLQRIPTLPQDALLRLLEASFAFIEVEELHEVPIKVLSCLRPVPPAFLKQLGAHMDQFRQLPRPVQRQVWELDSTLFRRHAAPSVHGYCEEQFTVMKCLNMKVALTPLPAVDAAAEPQRRPAPGLTRSAARKGSQPLRKLVQLVEGSRTLYLGLLALCRQQYSETGAPALCSLRTQLAMLIADLADPPPPGRGSAPAAPLLTPAAAAELRGFDECARLIALLDGMCRDGHCDRRRLNAVLAEVAELERKASTAATAGVGAAAGKGKKRRAAAAVSDGEGSDSDGGESIVRAGGDGAGVAAWKSLVDAGMALADPPMLHLLLHETVRALEAATEATRIPKEDVQLQILVKLLALALGTQKLAQQRRGAATLPTADGSVMTVFLPHLQEHITSSLLDEEDDEEEGGGAAAGAGARDPCSLQGAEPMRAQLAQPMAGDALKRKVALAYVVQRLEKGDLASAAPVLAAAVDAISDSSPALQSEAAFAWTLADLLPQLIATGKLPPASPLFTRTLELLLRSTTVSVEVVMKVVEVLQAAAPHMDAAALAAAADEAVVASRTVRHAQKRRGPAELEYERGGRNAPAGGAGSSGYTSGGYTSGGASSVAVRRGGYSSVSDGPARPGAKSVPQDPARALFAKLRKDFEEKLTAELAPHLHSYVLRGVGGRDTRGGSSTPERSQG